MTSSAIAYRGSVLHCLDEPEVAGEDAIEYYDDALLLVENGHISALGHFSESVLPNGVDLVNLQGKLLVPGFVDTHIHYPQVDIIASYGTQLLEWLETYTFPAEMAFAEESTSVDTAKFFIDELLRNGTTSALVFGTVHKQSVNAFFDQAKSRQLRMICGKVMMDRNAPDALRDTVESGYKDSQALIKQWHNKDRLGYAVTPRFAPTSTDAQLASAGKLLDENPGVHLHTHLAESADECDWVASLFPSQQDYLAVYEQFGLVRKRSVFAHSIHLSNQAWNRLSAAKAAVAHCPTSNLFIGSGLFDMRAAMKAGVPIGLGTDVGGGDSFSLLRTINEAYKIQQLQGYSLKPEQSLYLATLGGARALDLDAYIGNFSIGKEADFVALDPHATPLMSRKAKQSKDWRSTLFNLTMMGDDRCIYDTYILGRSSKRCETA